MAEPQAAAMPESIQSLYPSLLLTCYSASVGVLRLRKVKAMEPQDELDRLKITAAAMRFLVDAYHLMGDEQRKLAVSQVKLLLEDLGKDKPSALSARSE